MKSRITASGTDPRRPQKKRALTADDLLRMQEEPAAKRMRVDDLRVRRAAFEEEDSGGSGSGSGSDELDGEEVSEGGDGSEEDSKEESGEEGSGFEEGEAEAAAAGEDEDEDDSDDSDDEPFSLSGPQVDVEDRFASALRNRELKEDGANLTQVQLKTETANTRKEVEGTKDEADDLKDAAPLPVQFKTTPMTTFTSLGISSPLRAALQIMSITNPTEVQSACIPPILLGVFLLRSLRVFMAIACSCPLLRSISWCEGV
jgi:ATP-dependent RNA helicase DDX49/DBP8